MSGHPISSVVGGRLRYRGADACELATASSVEEIASLLWSGNAGVDFSETPLHVISGTAASGTIPFTRRGQSALAIISSHDPLAGDLRPEAAMLTGWRVLNLLTSVAAASPELEETIEATLVRDVDRRHAAALVRMALILSADEGVDASVKVAREVASAGSSPYGVVVAALAAFEGSVGAVLARTEELFDALRKTRNLEAALGRRVEPLEGFRDPSFGGRDPRADLLLTRFGELLPRSPEVSFARKLATAGEAVSGKPVSFAFALVALCRGLGMPPGTAIALMAIGRSIGWTAHAVEVYAADRGDPRGRRASSPARGGHPARRVTRKAR